MEQQPDKLKLTVNCDQCGLPVTDEGKPEPFTRGPESSSPSSSRLCACTSEHRRETEAPKQAEIYDGRPDSVDLFGESNEAQNDRSQKREIVEGQAESQKAHKLPVNLPATVIVPALIGMILLVCVGLFAKIQDFSNTQKEFVNENLENNTQIDPGAPEWDRKITEESIIPSTFVPTAESWKLRSHHFGEMHWWRAEQINDDWFGLEDVDTGFNLFSKMIAGERPVERLMIINSSISKVGVRKLVSMKLSALELASSTIDDSVYQGISKMHSLDTLVLSNVKRSDFKFVGTLKRLRNLAIRSDIITDEGLGELSKLSSLSNLEVSHNRSLTANGIKMLGKLKKLKRLSLDSTGLTDQALAKLLDDIPSLEYLSVKNGTITDAALVKLKKHKQLSYLDLTGNRRITSKTLETISGNTNLQHLKIGSTGINPASLAKLKRLPWLTTLDISNMQLTDDDIQGIVNIPLVGLRIAGNPVTDKGIARLKPMESLITLDASFCPGVTKSFITKQLSQLRLVCIEDGLVRDFRLAVNNPVTMDAIGMLPAGKTINVGRICLGSPNRFPRGR